MDLVARIAVYVMMFTMILTLMTAVLNVDVCITTLMELGMPVLVFDYEPESYNYYQRAIRWFILIDVFLSN